MDLPHTVLQRLSVVVLWSQNLLSGNVKIIHIDILRDDLRGDDGVDGLKTISGSVQFSKMESVLKKPFQQQILKNNNYKAKEFSNDFV